MRSCQPLSNHRGVFGRQVKPALKRLLFVDDEPAIRKTLPLILRRYGFTVTVCASVAEALEAIRTQECDVLLCDLNIEREGDGYEVIRAMREVNPDCVTIVLTGFPGVKSAIKGIHLGIDDYILKPTNADTLVALLAEKLEARRRWARILAISGNESALQAWRTLLEANGYEVVSSLSDAGAEKCTDGRFDLFLIGRFVPASEKAMLIERIRQCSAAPVIALRANPAEIVEADYHIDPDPELVLKTIGEIMTRSSAMRGKAQPAPASPD